MDQDEAREALAAIQGAKDRLATRMDYPLWRHSAFGVISGMLVTSAVAPPLLFVVLYVPSMAALLWLGRGDKLRTGVFVNGWRKGRTLPVSILLLLVLLGLMALALKGHGQPFPAPVTLLAGGVAMVLGTLGSIWWQRVYIAELTRGEQP